MHPVNHSGNTRSDNHQPAESRLQGSFRSNDIMKVRIVSGAPHLAFEDMRELRHMLSPRHPPRAENVVKRITQELC